MVPHYGCFWTDGRGRRQVRGRGLQPAGGDQTGEGCRGTGDRAGKPNYLYPQSAKTAVLGRREPDWGDSRTCRMDLGFDRRLFSRSARALTGAAPPVTHNSYKPVCRSNIAASLPCPTVHHAVAAGSVRPAPVPGICLPLSPFTTTVLTPPADPALSGILFTSRRILSVAHAEFPTGKLPAA